jgi:hypothetical protein
MMRKALVVAGAAALALGTGGVAFADAGAGATASDSPGVLSGNVVEIPMHLPLNLCGDSIGLVGLLSPSADNGCVNG